MNMRTLYRELSKRSHPGQKAPLVLTSADLDPSYLGATYALFLWATDNHTINNATGQPYHGWQLSFPWTLK